MLYTVHMYMNERKLTRKIEFLFILGKGGLLLELSDMLKWCIPPMQ